MTTKPSATVRIDEGGLRRDGSPGPSMPLYAGAVAYARVPPRAWGKCLAAVRGIGLTCVEAEVAWSAHEAGPGRFDFQSGSRDLGAFLDACAGEGLAVMLRVGPQVGGELSHAGLPERVVRDPAMQARTGRETPVATILPPRGYLAPSYASTKFLDEARRLYAAIGEVTASRRSPDGPVVALVVDHERSGLLRGGPYCGDYHPDALARWHALNGDSPPPRSFAASAPEDLAPHLAWLRFRDARVAEELGALSALLDEAGLEGLLRTHGFSPIGFALSDVAGAERAVDVAGMALAHGARHHAALAEQVRYLVGSSRLPFASQLLCGTYPWGPPLRDEDGSELLLRSLALGLRGFSAHMAVERDRWVGALVDREGRVRAPLGEVYTKVLRALAQVDAPRLEPVIDVGLVVPRAYLHLDRASSHLGPLGPAAAEYLGLGEALSNEACFGLEGPVQIEQATWRRAIEAALGAAKLPYALVESGAPAERLARFKALVAPTFDFAERGLVERLRGFVAGGGRLLAGPRIPTRDEAMTPLDGALPGARLEPAMRGDRAALEAAVRALADEAQARRGAPAVEPDVEVMLHCNKAGGPGPGLLFVTSHADRPRTATIPLPWRAEAADPLDGRRFEGETLEVPVMPGRTRMLVLA